MFQFHHGAIGSLHQWPYFCHFRCFNSIMVRLGEHNLYENFRVFVVSIPSWCDWEQLREQHISIGNHVSIPSWCDWELQNLGAKERTETRFNSIMVRLGVFDNYYYPYYLPQFQFHHGAIGSVGNKHTSKEPYLFQFHHGAIGSLLIP